MPDIGSVRTRNRDTVFGMCRAPDIQGRGNIVGMRTYETTILVNPGSARNDYEGTIATIRAAYEGEGAEWIELDKWEERKLTYPIAGQTSALYLIGYFNGPTDIITKIERRARLTDVIMRQLIIARDGKAYEAIRVQRARSAERAATREREAERDRDNEHDRED
ncbi:MAG: 30S ribosomal protein S6 [Planctomycetota bacterium]|nr:MAG: 30S ribosomal protein S6 [Planctomycetota bacterium]